MILKRVLPVEILNIINLMILSALFLLPLFSHDFSKAKIVYFLCVLIGLIVLWIVLTLEYISEDLFNFYSLFIIAAVLFNAGQALLEIFHLNPNDLLEGKFDNETLIPTLYLVVLSLMSFHAGGVLSTSWKRRLWNSPHYSPDVSSQAVRIVGYVLLVISVVPAAIMTLEALKVVLQDGYFALYQREVSTGLASGLAGVKKNLADFFPPGLLSLLAGSKKHFKIRYITFAVTLGYVLVLIFLGYRGYATLLLIASLWVWHRVVKPLPIATILIGGSILLFIIFPTIHAVRNVEGASRLNLQFLVTSFYSIENPAVTILTEIGGTMRTIAYTIQLIPQDRPFAMGSTYGYAATAVVPNLFWDLHPAFKYGNLDHWLTRTVAPEFYEKGGGLGYSFIAEAYANFGWWGTPLVMGLVGFVIAGLTRWSAGRDEYGKIAVIGGCIATMLFWVRADVTIWARPLDYYLVPSYVLFLYIRKKIQSKL